MTFFSLPISGESTLFLMLPAVKEEASSKLLASKDYFVTLLKLERREGIKNGHDWKKGMTVLPDLFSQLPFMVGQTPVMNGLSLPIMLAREVGQD